MKDFPKPSCRILMAPKLDVEMTGKKNCQPVVNPPPKHQWVLLRPKAFIRERCPAKYSGRTLSTTSHAPDNSID